VWLWGLANSAQNFVFPNPPLTFTVPTNANMICVVNSTVQLRPAVTPPNGATTMRLRNAISRDGTAPVQDDAYGVYFTANGLLGNQPSVSRSSIFFVAHGTTVAFGISVSDVNSNPAFIGGGVDYMLTWNCS
jgi:hypothetical protein